MVYLVIAGASKAADPLPEKGDLPSGSLVMGWSASQEGAAKMKMHVIDGGVAQMSDKDARKLYEYLDEKFGRGRRIGE